MASTKFRKVWFQRSMPAQSWFAYRDRLTGELEILEDRAEFRRKGAVVFILSDIRSVSVGQRGSDFINRWVTVEFGEGNATSTAYLNDAGWLGWRPLLTRSNRRMSASLEALAAKS